MYNTYNTLLYFNYTHIKTFKLIVYTMYILKIHKNSVLKKNNIVHFELLENIGYEVKGLKKL